MKLYGFALIVQEFDDVTADQIYAQCPDTSIGKSNGIMYVAFDRETVSLESVLNTAAADLRQLGISPTRVEMDVPEAAMAS